MLNGCEVAKQRRYMVKLGATSVWKKRGRVKQYPTWHRKDPKEDANKEKAILRGVMVVAGVIFAFNICDTWQRRPKT